MDTSLQTYYLREHHLAVCRPVGAATEDRATHLLYFLFGAEGATPESFNRLVDLRFVTDFTIQSAVIHGFASIRREEVERLSPARTAIIAPNPEAEEVARIFAALMKGTKISVRIFGDARSATDWLGVPEQVLEPETAHHA